MSIERRMGIGVMAVLALLAMTVAGCGGSGLEQVQLDSGPITGAQEEAGGEVLWVFKGIPYAAPPVGELRWKPPQPVASWEKPLPCTSFGPSCPQPSQVGLLPLDVGETGEDCLYLNVWSPADSPEERLPVMVWIHGGSFETGSGSMAVYDGHDLAALGVVVVTINYRVGPLGFLAHSALSAESPQGISGNYGLLDEIAALQWVQRNIAAFGGDPANVTVFGESAGAISVLDLLVSPLAEDLFAKAIAQSAILLDHGFGVTTASTLEAGEETGAALVERLGVDPAGDVAAQMRAKTPEELLAAAEELAEESGLMERGLFWKPVADGHVLPDLPTKLWATGAQHSVPLLIGSNADEGNAFLAGLTVSAEDFNAQMEQVFGDHADEAKALYPVADQEDIVPMFSRTLTEVGFASTVRMAARAMSPVSPTFVYHFTRVPFGNPLGAFHGVEIPYVFGTVDLFTGLGKIEQADYDLSGAIMGYWTRFAATGDPNGGDAPAWPRYDPSSDRHLELGDAIRVGAGLSKEACDLADRVRGLD